MRRLHLFNPSHDEALAAHTPYYYPARAARMLGNDLAVLPAWWAAPGDAVLLPDAVELPPADFTGKGIRFLHLKDLRGGEAMDFEEICPWGWDALLVHQLQAARLAPDLLPDAEQLEVIRQLSSRETAVQLLHALRDTLKEGCGTSSWCTSESAVWTAVEHYGAAMLKAPWSSSGRGVFAVHFPPNDNQRRRVEKLLREQGGVEVEPFYTRVQDFAAEFQIVDHHTTYLGLSVFTTTENGGYTGNRIGGTPFLESQLPATIRQQLPAVIAALQTQLDRLVAPHYQGPLGIDMMVVGEDDGTLVLHPCIEINLRRTMGHVALALQPLLPEGHTGIYRIQPVKSPLKQEENCIVLTPQAKEMEAVLILEG